MEIILMRHGKPLLAQSGRISAAEMGRWINNYNLSEVGQEDIPTSSLNLDGVTVVSSTASRALSSAHALGCQPTVVDAIFCEAELPYARWRYLRLPAGIWSVFFRILWFLGYSHGVESRAVARVRAGMASQKLIALAQSGPVLLIGHGVMNRLIAKELKAQRWEGPAKLKNSYWSTNLFHAHH